MQQAGGLGAERQPPPAGAAPGAYLLQHAELLPPPTHYSIDVECIATGPTHLDRAVAQISLVVRSKPRKRVHDRVTVSEKDRPRKGFRLSTRLTQ